MVYHFPADANLPAEERDEVFQDTFLALYRNLDRKPQIQALDQWLATVAKRNTWKIVNRRRKHLREQLHPDYDFEDPDHIPEKVVETKVLQARVRRGIGSLTEPCRSLLTLLFFKYDSVDYDRLSSETGLKRGSIGPMRQRCLAKFKKLLAGMGINQKNVSKWLG